MAYSEFSLADVKKAFQLTTEENTSLFAKVSPVSVSDFLATILAENIPLALLIGTEKARSEMIVVPILIELRKLCERRISLFSGMDFNVDPDRGLTGQCDYILSRSTEQLYVSTPVATIVEAKKDDIKSALGQCAAAMVAARIYNEREGNRIPVIYGMVTTGSIWRALVLDGQTIRIDCQEYYLQEVGKILGILQRMVS